MLLLTIALLTADPPTYAEDVAAVLHAKCASCHRPGQSGPFPLLSWEDADEHAETIAAVIADDYMPPWPPSAKSPRMKHDRSLGEEEKSLIARWVEAGAPAGDLKTAPEPPVFASEWMLGEPDLVLEMDEAYPVPADGRDIYRWFSLPLDSETPLYLTAYEFKSTSNGAVHHSLLYLDKDRSGRTRTSRDGKPGFRGMRVAPREMIGGFVPGTVPLKWEDGLAVEIPAGSDLVLQTHFHPTGRAESEKSRVGLYFTDEKPERPLHVARTPTGFGVVAGIDIPAGDDDYTIEAKFELPADATAVGVSGHAHYICESINLTAELPGGETKTLLDIADWDLDWQGDYHFEQPVKLPKGTVLTTTLVYDNSEANPDNPFSPPRRVKWGEESTDEMGSTDLILVADDAAGDEALARAIRFTQFQMLKRGHDFVDVGPLTFKERAKLMFLDGSGDKLLQEDELPKQFRRFVKTLDIDGDGALSFEEAKPVRRLLQ